MLNFGKRQIPKSTLESALITGHHPSGSSDLAVLERYLQPLCNGELEPDAVLYYGLLLESTDIKYIPAFVKAVTLLMEQDQSLLSKLRMRSGLTFQQLQRRCRDLQEGFALAQKGVADGLRKHYEDLDFGSNDKFLHLLARLDA